MQCNEALKCDLLIGFFSFFFVTFVRTATRARATAVMVVAVDVISVATVKSATNATKWATLHGNAKKMPIDATDATVNIKKNEN